MATNIKLKILEDGRSERVMEGTGEITAVETIYKYHIYAHWKHDKKFHTSIKYYKIDMYIYSSCKSYFVSAGSPS